MFSPDQRLGFHSPRSLTAPRVLAMGTSLQAERGDTNPICSYKKARGHAELAAADLGQQHSGFLFVLAVIGKLNGQVGNRAQQRSSGLPLFSRNVTTGQL